MHTQTVYAGDSIATVKVNLTTITGITTRTNAAEKSCWISGKKMQLPFMHCNPSQMSLSLATLTRKQDVTDSAVR